MDLDIQTFAREVLTERIAKLVAIAPSIGGDDIEAIHEMRVASRRLRAALDLFQPLLSPKTHAKKSKCKQQHDDFGIDQITGIVRRVTRSLGAARDLDVLILTLNRLASALPKSEQTSILAFIREQQDKRRDLQPIVDIEVKRLLQSDLQSRVSSAVRFKPQTQAKRTLDASHWAGDSLRERSFALQTLSDGLHDETQIERHHAMRIAAKRLRYTLEIFKPHIGKDGVQALLKVQKLQELLGEVHDCDVIAPLLTKLLLNTIRDETRKLPKGAVGLEFADHAHGLTTLIMDQRRRRQDNLREAGNLWQQFSSSLDADTVAAQLD